MIFSKIKYNSGRGILKVRIEDQTGALQENWTIMMDDFPKWVGIMCKKYGFKIQREKTDLDWTNL